MSSGLEWESNEWPRYLNVREHEAYRFVYGSTIEILPPPVFPPEPMA